jgi:hypothetical protein
MTNSKKIILDLCGGTGSWSKPYRDAGYDVRLFTLPDNNVLEWEASNIVNLVQNGEVYGILAAPPCTKFSKAAWQIKKADRDFKEGMECVRACMDIIWSAQEIGAPLAFWALENPMGYLYNFMGKPAYYFQPWWFGDETPTRTKRTALWGYFNLPRRTVHTRNFPFISPHSRPAGDGMLDKNKRNEAWGAMSVEDRAKTSNEFAVAFYLANK